MQIIYDFNIITEFAFLKKGRFALPLGLEAVLTLRKISSEKCWFFCPRRIFQLDQLFYLIFMNKLPRDGSYATHTV